MSRLLYQHHFAHTQETCRPVKHRGNVELYFKHRYQDFNYRIGSLTEYFKLADIETVWDDLRQMKPKVLAPVELDVLEDNFISSLCSD